MSERKSEFDPDWISPPGDTIADIISEKNWKQKELAVRMGVSDKHLNQLIKGKVSLTSDMALRLATVLGSTEGFWLRREAQYQEQLLKLNSLKTYEKYIHWLDKFPLSDLKRIDILPNVRASKSSKPNFVRKLLEFFAVSSPQEWENQYLGLQANFRRTKSDNKNIGAVTAWLRLGEICVEQLEKERNESGENIRFNKTKFEKTLHEIRQFTIEDPEVFQEKIQQICLNSGVYLILVPSIPTARISGVARWLSRKRPMIQLSLYGRSNDKFWFNFYHESAHLLLHSDDKKCIYIDNEYEIQTESNKEMEANRWAEQILIPDQYRPNLWDLQSITQIRSFAANIGIHPGIVVGRLQKEGIIRYSAMNDLKVNYCFEDE